MNKKQQLINLIKSSELAEKDKNEWESFVGNLTEDAVEIFLEILEKFPKEFGWFNEIYKRKKEAFELVRKNKAEGNRILSGIYQEEFEKIQTLLY